MRRYMVAVGVVLVLGFAAGLVPAGDGQTAGAKPGPVGSQTPASGPRPSCNGPEYHQFDFWVGDWNVTSAGQMAGMNLVTRDVAGCVIHEHWTGLRGGTGESFNFYDRHDGKWHQLWVSSDGGVVRLTGSYADGKMVYAGDTIQPDGTAVLARMTFFNNEADRTIRQLWETSPDEGKTWQVAFDGVYTKKK